VRLLKGIDIRTVGSGNVGATNALRVLGKSWGIFILFLDILKGFLPVYFLGGSSELNNILIGLACICGHNWTIFLKFKGGKGIATTLGVLIGLSFKVPGLNIILGILLVVWVACFAASRIISFASIISAAMLPVLVIFFKQSKLLIGVSILLSLFAIWRHKANLKRLFQGKESRLF